MQKRATNIIILTSFAVLLFFGACRTKKQIISTSAVVVDTAVTIAPHFVDTFKNVTSASKQVYIPPIRTAIDYYNDAYFELEQMLNDYRSLNFKRAVFITENAYFKNELSYDDFEKSINHKVAICNLWMSKNSLVDYKYSDSSNLLKNCAIYTLLKDTIYLMKGFPLQSSVLYDFEDFFGQNDWSKMFVTKLMQTGSGNCHSLPYLYKIIANELNADIFLSLAPNHIYLKSRNKKTGWYNTELTSGEFPSDAWIKASGYVSIESIKSGIYMDTLSQKQSVALCAYDLAKGYLYQTNNYNDGFVVKCCNLTLKHYPNNVNAILLKSETLRRMYDYELKRGNKQKAASLFDEMQKLYVQGLTLGYREMPKDMYLNWLQSAKEQKEKYTNSEIYRNFKSSKN